MAPGESVDVAAIQAALARGNTLANRVDVGCKTRVAGASPVATALQEKLVIGLWLIFFTLWFRF